MSLSSWLWGTSQVDEAVDKATSELLPSGAEDIALNLEISDQIRSKSVQPKDAMRALKRRLNHKNPNVQLLALSLSDTCIKNGGDHFLVEIASREFMDNLVSILKIPVLNLDVKNKILRLVQNWAIAFEGKPSLSYVGQVYKTLKNEGFKFPPEDLAVANSAMVDTQTAPEWIDSDVCLRCRTTFSFTNRKHHCRNCGQVFDQQCSAKSLPLPHFGIAQEVRVCDGCYIKLNKSKKDKTDDRKHRHSPVRHRSARELADEELQRAIQLSLEEVGAASVNGRHNRPGYVPSQPDPSPYSKWQTSEPPLVDRSSRPTTIAEEENDPDLRAAIEASLREASAPKASAPAPVETPVEASGYSYSSSSHYDPAPATPAVPNYDLQPLESDVILTFSQTIQDLEAQGGRDLSRYPAVNELFDKANGLRPKLAMSLDDTDRKEKLLQGMHEKLSQAVKLYDQLLTEQLSRPSWRAASSAASPGRYGTVDGSYNQWTQQPATSPAITDPSQRAWTYAPNHTQSYQQAQQVLAPATTTTSNVPYPPARQESYNSEPMPSSSQYGVPQQYGAPSPAPSHPPQQAPSQTQTFSLPFSPISQPQYQLPPQAPPSALPRSPPPQLANNGHPPQPSTSYASSVDAPQQVSSPPPESRSQILPYQSVVPSPAFNPPPRQNTVPYAAPPSSTPGPAAQQQGYYQLQPPPMQTPLPQFPVAPTSNPQSFSLYGPSPSLEQTERKEALLIDL